MVVNWNRMANYSRLVPRAEADAMGVKLSSNGDIHVGLPVPQMGTPFALLNGAFLSPLGIPCTEPPFGKIAVVDLKSRKVTWQRTLGTSRDSGPLGIPSLLPLPMGVPNIGGALTTRAGLVFIAATQERAIRAFDIRTGKRLWEMRLPVGGHATPMSYISPKSGRQFILLSTGGNASMASGMGDYVMAFAFPQKAVTRGWDFFVTSSHKPPNHWTYVESDYGSGVSGRWSRIPLSIRRRDTRVCIKKFRGDCSI